MLRAAAAERVERDPPRNGLAVARDDVCGISCDDVRALPAADGVAAAADDVDTVGPGSAANGRRRNGNPDRERKQRDEMELQRTRTSSTWLTGSVPFPNCCET